MNHPEAGPASRSFRFNASLVCERALDLSRYLGAESSTLKQCTTGEARSWPNSTSEKMGDGRHSSIWVKSMNVSLAKQRSKLYQLWPPPSLNLSPATRSSSRVLHFLSNDAWRVLLESRQNRAEEMTCTVWVAIPVKGSWRSPLLHSQQQEMSHSAPHPWSAFWLRPDRQNGVCVTSGVLLVVSTRPGW